MQECQINETSFQNCGFITSNFNIIANNTPNNSGYGTASLIRSDIDFTDVHKDDQGRIIIFNAAGCTWGNIYLPLGNNRGPAGPPGNPRTLRENYSANIIPHLMCRRLEQGAAGGDFNCVISPIDCTKNFQNKVSPSLRKLVSAFNWKDSYRTLFPKKPHVSRYYSNKQGEGASRIDRSYHGGPMRAHSATYISLSFSDHLALKVSYILPSKLDRCITPQTKPSYKIPPNVVTDSVFQTGLSESMLGWQQIKAEGVDLLMWWQLIVKKGIKEIAQVRGKELKKQRMGQLNLLNIRQAYLTEKVSCNQTNHLIELNVMNLKITEWYENESKAINLMARTQDTTMNEKVRIYHHGLHPQFRKRSSITRLETETGIKEGHNECAKALEDNVAKHLLNPAHLDPACQ